MKVIIAMDSFKGSLSSMDAGVAVREGILHARPEWKCYVNPMADGGEGTVQALHAGMGGVLRTCTVAGPLGDPVAAEYAILPDGETAVLEMAAAAGLTLIPPEKRDPLLTTTFGVGQLIRDALEQGCRKFIVGIGGSATNDGGVGMLRALGYRFLDAAGADIPLGAAGLEKLHEIQDTEVIPGWKEARFRIACDVDNPLCGNRGCSRIYGPQKGATEEAIQKMDLWLARLGELTREKYPAADPELPGAGAAGGLGFAFSAFANACLESGARIVMDETGLEEKIRWADLVITGEGRLDGQTAMGKGPGAVAALAKKYGKTVIALAGGVTADAENCHSGGIDAFFSVVPGPVTLEEAMDPENTRRNLSRTAGQVARLIR